MIKFFHVASTQYIVRACSEQTCCPSFLEGFKMQLLISTLLNLYVIWIHEVPKVYMQHLNCTPCPGVDTTFLRTVRRRAPFQACASLVYQSGE